MISITSPKHESRRTFLRDATAVAGALAIPLAMRETLDAVGEAQAIGRDSRPVDEVARDEKYASSGISVGIGPIFRNGSRSRS